MNTAVTIHVLCSNRWNRVWINLFQNLRKKICAAYWKIFFTEVFHSKFRCSPGSAMNPNINIWNAFVNIVNQTLVPFCRLCGLDKHTHVMFVPVIPLHRSAALHLTVPLHRREEEPPGLSRETQTRRPPLRTGTQPASNDERGETVFEVDVFLTWSFIYFSIAKYVSQ